MRNKYSLLFCLLFLILGLLLRVYVLGAVPPGLTNDEADIGYDAYSLLLTGHDQWNKAIPLTSFQGFGDYRLPLYTYLVVPMVMIFDLNALAVRLPSAIFGTVSILLVYLVVLRLFSKSNVNAQITALSAMFFMAVSPWAIGLSRIGIESNVGITFFLAGLLLFLYGLQKKYLFLCSFLLFGFTLYTYTSYTLFTPVALLVLLVFFKDQLKKQKKQIVLGMVIFLILTIPLFAFRSTAGVRVSQVSFINSQDNIGLMAVLNDMRGSCSQNFPDILCKIFLNKQLLFANTFIRNYINHFSFSFLFLNGSSTQYSILPPRSLFYIIEGVFLLIGLYACVKKKIKASVLVMVLFLVSPLPDSITGEGHYSRAANMMPFMFIIEGVGASFLWESVGKLNTIFKYTLRLGFSLIVFGSFALFIISYFSYFPQFYSTYSQYGYSQWANHIQENKNAHKKIILSKYGNDTKQYIYYLFYTKYDPRAFQTKKDISYSQGSDGWVSIDKINNLYFVEEIPKKDELKKEDNNALIITHPKELPDTVDLKNAVLDKNGNPVFVFLTGEQLANMYEEAKTVE